MRLLTPDETRKHFELGIEKAREFFQVADEVEIRLINETPTDRSADASVQWNASSLSAVIRFDMDYLQRYSGDIWRSAGHEVAHLMSRELIAIKDRRDRAEQPFDRLLTDEWVEAIEMLTTRLHRMFLKACPDPGALGGLYGES